MSEFVSFDPTPTWGPVCPRSASAAAGDDRTRIAWLRRPTSELEASPRGKLPRERSQKAARLEAILLIADAPMPPRKIATLAGLADATEARTLMNRLNQIYDESGTPFRVERVAAGYRLLTRPEYSLWLGKVHQREAERKLTPTAMETLTIIAYRQPLTRADVEAIRGVQCSEMIKQLMDRGLVRIGGEEDSLGRPFLYETTRGFLETFGLRDLSELPYAERLRKPVASRAAA